MAEHETPLERWADRIERELSERAGDAASPVVLSRVMILKETGSTQDVARVACPTPGQAGLIVIADRQTKGRGRLGRVWRNHETGGEARGLGLAMTLAFDATALEARGIDAGQASLIAGLSALSACRDALSAGRGGVQATPEHAARVLGVRWPNDVVERGATGRKIAGVLIERAGDVLLVGVGINAGQRDFDAALTGKAVSLAMLGGHTDRCDLAVGVIGALLDAIARPPGQNAVLWHAADVLIGTRRAFEHAGRVVRGVVREISPTSHIEVTADDGSIVRLPALTTSLVHEA